MANPMPDDVEAIVKGERIAELCRERAATYGALRRVSVTALTLDAAADEIERLRALQGDRTCNNCKAVVAVSNEVMACHCTSIGWALTASEPTDAR